MKQTFTLLLLLAAFSAFPQKALKITYQKTYNGKPIQEDNPTIVFTNTAKTRITSQKILDGKEAYPVEQSVVMHGDNTIVRLAQLSGNDFVATLDSSSIKNQSLQLLPDTKTILGYSCKKAKTVINSNNIGLWYTNDLNIKGGPSSLGQDLGLVLEMSSNGTFVITATKVEKLKNADTYLDIIPKGIAYTDALSYSDRIWKAGFTTLPVLQDEIINFSDTSQSNDSILRFGNGTIALRKIKFPEIKKDSQVFIQLTEQSNGDAYDRTGSVFVIPEDQKQSFMDGLKNGAKTLPIYDNGNGKQYQGVVRTDSYTPLLELMRFFTPFGIHKYNHIKQKGKEWHDIVPYREDISELAPYLSGKELWVGTFIGNYDKGGHKVNVTITIHPNEASPNGSSFVMPLFNTVNVMEMAGQEYSTMFSSDKGLKVTFTLDKDVKNARLRYITTGHGGWENGDEFLPKKNSIYLDGKEAFSFIPWRQDCGTYRLFNPASGNSDNGLTSSDYSRSNWCPGTVTNPDFIWLGDLKAGTHTITVTIPQGAPEGNSFSAWNVSGVLLGE